MMLSATDATLLESKVNEACQKIETAKGTVLSIKVFDAGTGPFRAAIIFAPI